MGSNWVIRRVPWLERSFPTALPLSMFPSLLERLRGTPARVEDRLLGISRERLTTRLGDSWSIQENLGHLILVEQLWAARISDFEAAATELRAAHFEAWRVGAAGFNERPVGELFAAFRTRREVLVARLCSLDADVLEHVSWHTRLRQPMGMADLMGFIAEHDDHHLASISELLALGSEPLPPSPGNVLTGGSV